MSTSIPSWPGLPQFLLKRGHQTSMPALTLRTQMDAGPPLVRGRFSAGITPVKGKEIMSAAQLAILKTFYLTTLQNGALVFQWTDQTIAPVGSVTALFRFVTPPIANDIGGSYEVDLDLEMMP